MKKSIPFLLIVTTVFAVYAPALRDGLVWDDTALILRDPLIRSWRLIQEGFNHFLFVDATASDFYRPLQRVVYTMVYCGFIFNPTAYHLTSILWHAAAASALFLFAIELLRAFDIEEQRRTGIALTAALIWAIHPIQSAAVVYISGLADPLAATFGFAACYFVLRSARASGSSIFLWSLLASFALLLSAMSKEAGFIFVALALALPMLLRRWDVAWKVGLAAMFVAALYLPLRQSAEHDPSPLPREPAPFSERPITVARAAAEYTGLLVFPIHLHMDRQVDAVARGTGEARMDAGAWRELQTLLGIALIALAIFWAMRARKRNRLVFVLLVLAGLSYLPMSGIALLNAAVAEHWVYLPSAFLFLAAAVAIVDLAEGRRLSPVARVTMSILLAGWCAFLGMRTFVRTFDWKDQRTFLESTIAAGGDSARMLINLGGLELSEGRLDLAKTHLRTALQKQPDQPLAVLNLAAVALKQNDFKTARELLHHAKDMPVVDARANEMIAVLDNKEHGKADLMRMRLASRTGPADWSIEKRYIKVLDETGSTSGAIKELEHCLATEWYRAESWQLLGQLLEKIGQHEKAAEAAGLAEKYDVHLHAHANAL